MKANMMNRNAVFENFKVAILCNGAVGMSSEGILVNRSDAKNALIINDRYKEMVQVGMKDVANAMIATANKRKRY